MKEYKQTSKINLVLFKTLPIFACLALLLIEGCADISADHDPIQEDTSGKSGKSCGAYPSDYLEYLDDTKCRKILPSNRDREFQCPIQNSETWITQPPQYLPVKGNQSTEIEVDATALDGFVPEDAAVTMILVRRINGVPYYRYLSNGRHATIVETWSSSKFLGVMNASETLRYYSDGKAGLDSTVDNIPVGDLVTVVHNYDEKNYTSNGLMSWFHDVGGRFFANEMIHSRWLHRPDSEVYGANYGAKSAGIGFNFEKNDEVVDIKPDQGWIKSNLLSTFTLAESLKRLVMYRENPETRLQYSTWEDVKVLLYGAQNSIWYDQETPQGMESDISVYMQDAVDINQMESNTQGRWRIFSKLGLGFSRGGELVHTDYACLPVFDQSGNPMVDQGAELIISIHLPVHEEYANQDLALANIYKDLVQAVMNGQIR